MNQGYEFLIDYIKVKSGYIKNYRIISLLDRRYSY